MPQIRQDPIAGYWVAISPERSKRPIEFEHFPQTSSARGPCPFCPGNEYLTPPEILRFPLEGEPWTLRVVPNKYPALLDDGAHEVIVDAREHWSSFGQAGAQVVEDVLQATRLRMLDHRQNPKVRYVQFFKNNGPAAGASIEHIHSQIMALEFVPLQLQLELDGARRYQVRHGKCPYCEEIEAATRSGRLIIANQEAVALAPYASRFPFETWILPHGHESHFEATPESVLQAAASILGRAVRLIEQELKTPPYNVILHTAPIQEGPLSYYHWHLEILPRASGIGGFEFGTGCYINAISPEEASARLRNLSSPGSG